MSEAVDLVLAGTTLPARIESLQRKVADKVAKKRTPGTVEKYRRDFAAFERWCAALGATALPASPATVAAYIADLSEPDDRAPYAPSTIGRKLAAIGLAHSFAGHPNPCRTPLVSDTMAGIRRDLGIAPRAQKRGVSTADVRAACSAMGDRLVDLRDRVVLLVGYAGAFRRSEIVMFDVDSAEQSEEGLSLHVRRAKTDQQGKGVWVPIVYGQDPVTCPVRAWRTWLEAAGITEGPVLRPMHKSGQVLNQRLSAHSVALIVKRHMGPLGHDIGDFAGHSLRRGMATTAARNGAKDRTIRETTRHASSATLEPYLEEGRRFEDPASGYLGL